VNYECRIKGKKTEVKDYSMEMKSTINDKYAYFMKQGGKTHTGLILRLDREEQVCPVIPQDNIRLK